MVFLIPISMISASGLALAEGPSSRPTRRERPEDDDEAGENERHADDPRRTEDLAEDDCGCDDSGAWREQRERRDHGARVALEQPSPGGVAEERGGGPEIDCRGEAAPGGVGNRARQRTV